MSGQQSPRGYKVLQATELRWELQAMNDCGVLERFTPATALKNPPPNFCFQYLKIQGRAVMLWLVLGW